MHVDSFSKENDVGNSIPRPYQLPKNATYVTFITTLTTLQIFCMRFFWIESCHVLSIYNKDHINACLCATYAIVTFVKAS